MDLDEARKQKLEELKKRQLEEQAETEAEERVAFVVKSLLEEPARQRLNNIKLVNRKQYLKALQAILYLQKAGHLQEKISEEDLKQLLGKIENKREIKIKRK